ncbi:acetyl-CoA carboxylase [Aureococcus anophagefferens]|nr:acetyl-CoA carboxylase [Aureococcus anophagefferens]
MASAQDLDANAEFVRLADRVVEVPSGSNKNNYANVELIIDIAVKESVDAVWPGWGHASENPELPDGLAARGIVFIGPDGGPMRALGDKIAASILAQDAEAMVTTEDECLKAAAIGYPVMLKAPRAAAARASMSHSEDELKSNFVQRRFQKIFEEAPAAIAKPEVFREMEKAAMRLTQSIGYSGAGTVEYLYHAATDKFYLELNPRLQVEHPCTEGITFINMPATQLQDLTVAAIDFFETPYPKVTNHIIAARTAENPDEGFKPTSGSIHRVKFQSTKNFGHLFASGATREIARRHLVLALKSVEIRGVIRNPVEYLVELLETDEFKENRIDTALDGDGQDLVRFPSVITYEGLKYFSIAKSGPETFALQINGQTVTAKVRYLQDDGAQVNAGEPYVEVEAMKMIMALKTAESGAIKHEMSPGSIISTGDLLASLTLSDPSSVVKIEPFTGTFDLLGAYLVVEGRYAGRPLDGVVRDLIAEHKDALGGAIAVARGHQAVARTTDLCFHICEHLLETYTDRLKSGVKGTPPTLGSVVAQLAALPGDKYSDLAPPRSVAMAPGRHEPATPRTLDTKLFNKSKLTKGYALMELETGTPFGTAFLGNKTGVVRSTAGRGGEPPVVFLLYACQSDFGGGVAKVQEALETALEALAIARKDSKVPMTSASSVVVRVPKGFGTVSSVVGAAALDLVMKNLAAKLAALHVDSFAVRVATRTLRWRRQRRRRGPALEAVDAKVADDFVPSPFAKRRATARRAGSTFCYDFVGLLACAAKGAEGGFPGSLKADELVWADDAKTALKPAPGTPPGTNKSGSFGVPEDDVYKAASVYAGPGHPRIYVACNSGAHRPREELKPKFKVKWNNEANPGQGFEYVYLDRADYEALEPGTVLGSFKGDDFVLSAIAARRTASASRTARSGTIAGETSRAYQDGFTLSYVTGRSVGIGAYLVRLGQRTIQMNAAR